MVLVSVNRVVVIPTPKTVIDRVNELGISEKQPEEVQFTNRDNRVSINDLNLNLDNNDDDNSNTSDESFDNNKEYQGDFDKEGKDNNLATNEVQEDHLQLPFQQHQTATLLTDNPSKIRSAKSRSVKGMKKKTKKHKRQKIQRNEPEANDDDDNSNDDHSEVDNSTLNLGVNDDESIDATEEAAKPHANGID